MIGRHDTHPWQSTMPVQCPLCGEAVTAAIFVNKVIFSLFTAFNRVTTHCDNVIVTIPYRISTVFGSQATKTTVFVFKKFVFKLYLFQPYSKTSSKLWKDGGKFNFKMSLYQKYKNLWYTDWIINKIVMCDFLNNLD